MPATATPPPTTNLGFQQFLDERLYPAMYARADELFPPLHFQRTPRGWFSPCKLDGTPSHDRRRDKCRITPKVPQVVFEQGGEARNIISHYQQQQGLATRMDAIRDLCSRLGLVMPAPADPEAYRRHQQRQDALERAARAMREALATPEGAEVAEYLKGQRGYRDDFIRWAEFGYCSPLFASSTLRALFTYRDQSGQEVCALPYDAGTRYTLAMPYRSGTAIQGFVFRSVRPDASPKYKDAFVSATASKRYHLYGLTGLRLTGNGEKDRDITVVEGEIDALRATFAGVPNVVAASGGNLSPEALDEARRRGVRRVTLLFDTEGSEDSQRDNHTKAVRAIQTIQRSGLTSMIAYLPSRGGKVDADTFLLSHTGEELQNEIDKAVPGAIFLFERLTAASAARNEAGGTSVPFKNFDDYRRAVIALCNDAEITPPTVRDLLFQRFAQATGSAITRESLREEADRDKAIADASRQRREVEAIAAEAYQLAKDGKVEQALGLLRSQRLSDASAITRQGEYGRLLELPDAASIRSALASRPGGIETPFVFGSGERRQRLVLPCGALTYICAPTSHGKSRMLENLAIRLAEEQERTAGDVLYFTFEEDAEAVRLEMLNIYAGQTLSANNLRSLASHYRTGRDYFGREADREAFQRREGEFLDMLTRGRLRVFYRDFDSDDLIGAVRFVAAHTRVKAVFVDYVQLLHKRGTRLQRKDELKEICADLMKLAVDTGLAVVLAAQLNREALSPVEMAVQNIAEASDIEHSANIVMLLWNSATRPLPRSGYFLPSASNKGEAKCCREAAGIEGRLDKCGCPFRVGTPGHIYALLAKNRGGERNLDAVLRFNGNTGVVEPNID